MRGFFYYAAVFSEVYRNMMSRRVLNFILSKRLALRAGRGGIGVHGKRTMFVHHGRLMAGLGRPTGGKRPFGKLFLQVGIPFLGDVSGRVILPVRPLSSSLSGSLRFCLPRRPFLANLFRSLSTCFAAKRLPSPAVVRAGLGRTMLILLRLGPRLTNTLFSFRRP